MKISENVIVPAVVWMIPEKELRGFSEETRPPAWWPRQGRKLWERFSADMTAGVDVFTTYACARITGSVE